MNTERQRLSNRRGSETINLEYNGLRYTVTFSRFDDARISEAFVQNHKTGNASDVAVRDAGILLSFCLQYGCPIDTISRALSRNADGSASGVMAAVLDVITKQCEAVGWRQ
jgi:hypothetical protein